MLTDIFASRYADRPIWTAVDEPERILLTQAWRIVAEQLMPYWHEKKVHEFNKSRWESVESKLSMELGRESLSPRTWGYYAANNMWQSGTYSVDAICKNWMLLPFKDGENADRFMKERISFVELAFRNEWERVVAANNKLPGDIKAAYIKHALKIHPATLTVPGSRVDALNAWNAQMNATFMGCVDELNERFRRAKTPLNLHNGFVQVEADHLVEEKIARPFWELVADAKWKNTEIDMMEAVDRREANDRDPSLYAAKALESAIKIISDEKGWTRSTEKNVNHYIDNLVAEKNGRFIEVWEGDAIRHLFAHARNEFGHGPGQKPMPELTQQQTDWAIEAAMSWTKSLIRRM